MPHAIRWRSRFVVVTVLCLALSIHIASASAVPDATTASLVAPAAVNAPAIAGTVVADRTGDPVSGAQVAAYRLYASGQWVAVAWTQSSATGTYSFNGLVAGTYRVGVTDWSGRFMDGFYSGAATLATASDIVYTGTTVPAITVRLTRDPIVRVYGSDRFSSSVEIAYEQYVDRLRGAVDFSGVHTIVLASGDDRAAADPLSAAGLCYAYQVADSASPNAKKGAPLVLVPSAGPVPSPVKQLVADIAVGDTGIGITGNGSGRVRLLVVGGTQALPDAQVGAIETFARAAGATVTVERIAGSDRYDIARRVAGRVLAQADVSSTDSVKRPAFALIANGADPRTYFDALALSPLSARTGAPILLVSGAAVPAKTAEAVADLGIQGSALWVAGGPATVGDAVFGRLGIPRDNRLAGATRYATAVKVAEKALAAGWLPATESGQARGVVVASKLSDALAGGALAGDADFGYPLVLAAPAALAPDTARYLASDRDGIGDAIVLGGAASMPDASLQGIRAALR